MSHENASQQRGPSRLADRVVGPWWVRLMLLALVGGLAGGQAPSTGLGAAFIAAGGLPLVASTLGLPSMGLRAVRLVAGGTAAVSGAVLSLQLGYVATVAGGQDPSGLSGALTFALIFAGAGAWFADLRLAARESQEQRERDDLAAIRHAEVMAQVGGASSARKSVRLRDLALLGLALRVLRR